MASRITERRERVTRGTGNVFVDLGFPDAVERQAKLHLAYALNQVLDARQLSQADAARVLGVTQPQISGLRRYKLAGYSVERLDRVDRSRAWMGIVAGGASSAYGSFHGPPFDHTRGHGSPRAAACSTGQRKRSRVATMADRSARSGRRARRTNAAHWIFF